MAYNESLHVVSLEAGADLSAAQYHLVAINASGQVVLAGDGAHADGVLLNKPDAAGKAAEVAIGGIVKVEAGGTVTRGGPVASNATGELVDAATGDVILGTALATGADGGIVPVLFQPRGAFA